VSWNLIQKLGGLKVPEIIDKELEKVRKQGQTPKKIYVGIGLYDEIRYEQFEPFAADLTADGQEASVFPDEEPTEYKGVKLHVVEDEDPDYLKIET
jgi:hypothetical protein